MPVRSITIGWNNAALVAEDVRTARDLTPLNESQFSALTVRTTEVTRQALLLRRPPIARGRCLGALEIGTPWKSLTFP